MSPCPEMAILAYGRGALPETLLECGLYGQTQHVLNHDPLLDYGMFKSENYSAHSHDPTSGVGLPSQSFTQMSLLSGSLGGFCHPCL